MNAEGFLKGDNQLDGIQTVGAKVIDKGSLRDNHNRIDAKVAADNPHNLRGNIRQTLSLLGWSGSSTYHICDAEASVRCAVNRLGNRDLLIGKHATVGSGSA